MFDRKLVSLWSAPNYNNRYFTNKNISKKNNFRCGNKGAILKLDEFL